jgi:hypothetical protein
MTGLVLVVMIWAYNRVTPATCLYTAVHGSYGSVKKLHISVVLNTPTTYSRSNRINAQSPEIMSFSIIVTQEPDLLLTHCSLKKLTDNFA